MPYSENQNLTPRMIQFETPRDESSIIKVIGVGGGGCNAVHHMYNQGIEGVDFIICNTDAQSLNLSPIPLKIQLGASLTEGRGAGSLPAVGRNAALENLEDIKALLQKNTKMLFITAGMGGGTGTGAAPVIASVARELNILTVGIVTIPFNFEGSKRRKQADEGIKELREHVDSLLVICNDKLRELYGDLPLSHAFGKADNILTTAAKGIAEIITVPGYINVDFEDVKTVMKESGVAIMGSGMAEGEDRALMAVEEALASPLLNDSNIDGASNILLYISSGSCEVTMDEVTVITDYIQSKAGQNAEIIWGNGNDSSLGDKISITLVATGFEMSGSEISRRVAEPSTILVGVLGEPTPAPPAPEAIIQQEPEEEEEDNLFTPPVAETTPDFFTLESATPQQAFSLEAITETPEATVEPVVFELNSSVDTTVSTFEEPMSEPDKTTPEDQATTPPQARLDMQEDLTDEMPPLWDFRAAGPVIDLTPRTPSPAPTPAPPQATTAPSTTEPLPRDMDKTASDRVTKLRELSLRLKTPDGVDHLEKEPAFMRRKVDLKEPRHSSESEVSQFSVSSDGKSGIELRQNNSYLHDQPD